MDVKGLTPRAGQRPAYAGIVVGRERTFACLLDLAQHTLDYPHTPLSDADAIRWVRAAKPTTVAVAAPPRLAPSAEGGARRKADERLSLSGTAATPSSRAELVGPRAWMARGMALCDALGAEAELDVDLGGTDGRLFETRATLAFKALLGHAGEAEARVHLDPGDMLASKHTPKGKRTRIELLRLALADLEVPPDRGVDGWARRSEWADATICAIVAAWRANVPGELVQIGDPSEGSITLRFADWSLRIARRTIQADESEAEERRASSPPPSTRRGRPAHSGWLLRLEGARTGGFGERELLDTLLGQLAEEGETWLPLKIKTVTMSGVVKAVDSGHCQLALCFDTHVKAIVDVREVRGGPDRETTWLELASNEDTPWHAEGQLVRACPYWLRVTNLREVDLAPEAFETGRKDGAYGPGLPTSGAPLVRWREKGAPAS